jgi:hypothetical protein
MKQNQRRSLSFHRNKFASRTASLAVAVWCVTLAAPAAAYVGPGAGITMLGALWAVLAGILLVLAGILIWPIKALLRRRKRMAAGADQTDMATTDGAKESAKAAAE